MVQGQGWGLKSVVILRKRPSPPVPEVQTRSLAWQMLEPILENDRLRDH